MDDVRDQLTDSAMTAEVIAVTAPAKSQGSDRRRPGRIAAVPPGLVPLLRRHTLLSDTASMPADAAADLPNDAADEIDGTRIFAGIVIGTLLATPFWLLVAIVIWWALR